MKKIKLIGLFILSAFVSTNGIAQTKMVGGAAMYLSKNIIENAVNSKDHTTLVAAVKAAGLVPTLESKGPLAGLCTDKRSICRLTCRNRRQSS